MESAVAVAEAAVVLPGAAEAGAAEGVQVSAVWRAAARRGRAAAQKAADRS